MKYTNEWWDGYCACIKDIRDAINGCSKETTLFIYGVIESSVNHAKEQAEKELDRKESE